jgi:hypothetical protein
MSPCSRPWARCWAYCNDRKGLGLRLVEECAGVGALRWRSETLGRVPYRISRFQGLSASGMPIPGLHRIEGVIELREIEQSARYVGDDLTLDLEDGRSIRLTLADDAGRVLAEGHGPKHGCSCC